MQISISAQSFELTDNLKSYIHKKAARLQKFSDNFQLLEVHILVEKYRNIVRMQLKSKAEVFLSDVVDKDSMYKAIDQSILKLEKQFLRDKRPPQTRARN